MSYMASGLLTVPGSRLTQSTRVGVNADAKETQLQRTVLNGTWLSQ